MMNNISFLTLIYLVTIITINKNNNQMIRRMKLIINNNDNYQSNKRVESMISDI
jgi:hypothetical protein